MTELPDLDQTSVATVHDIRSLGPAVPEVAVLLTISRHTAYAMVRSGQFRARQLGTRWVVPREVFHAWLNLTQPPSPPRNFGEAIWATSARHRPAAGVLAGVMPPAVSRQRRSRRVARRPPSWR